jgi:hypothetical protein
MTMFLISLLIALVIICVVLYCAKLLIAAFAVEQPWATLLYVVIVIICLLIFLQAVGGFSGSWTVFPALRSR